MKTQKDYIAIHEKQLAKIVSSYGFGSMATMSAMFKLQALKAGMPINEIFSYAAVEMERHEKEMKKIAFAQCH